MTPAEGEWRTVGTAGHVDHGKSALVEALTGTSPHHLPEEFRTGRTIEPGFGVLRFDRGPSLGIVDVPGHEAFLRMMIAGASGIDAALLVVAADEGPEEQTIEHVEVLRLLGIPSVVGVVTRIDRAPDPDWPGLVGEETAGMLREGGWASAPVVHTSARSGEGIDGLRALLGAMAARLPTRSSRDFGRLPIDRVFPRAGAGTVVTGTQWSGSFTEGEDVRILPSGLGARIRSIECHGMRTRSSSPGARMALALTGRRISPDTLRRGKTVVSEGPWQAGTEVVARLSYARRTAGLRPGTDLRIGIGTDDLPGTLRGMDDPEGEEGGWGRIRFRRPTVVRVGDRMILRHPSTRRVLAGAIVAEVREDPPGGRRRARTVTALHRVSVLPDPPAMLREAVRAAGVHGLPLEELRFLLRSGPQRDPVGSAPEIVVHRDRAYPEAGLEEAGRALLHVLATALEGDPLSKGCSLTRLRGALDLPADAFRMVLDRLERRGQVVLRGESASIPGRSAAPAPGQVEALRDLRLAVHQMPWGIFDPARDLPPAVNRREDLARLIRHLADEAEILPLPEGLWITAAGFEAGILRLRSAFPDGIAHPPAAFRDILNLPRRLLLPLLERTDALGVTGREGPLRRVLPSPLGEPAAGP